MRRHLLGIISLTLLIVAAVGLYRGGLNSGEWSMAASGCLRAGLVLGAVWLALPQIEQLLRKFPAWLLATVGIGAVVLVLRPKLITFVGPILIAIIALQYAGKFLKKAGLVPDRRTRVQRPEDRRSS